MPHSRNKRKTFGVNDSSLTIRTNGGKKLRDRKGQRKRETKKKLSEKKIVCVCTLNKFKQRLHLSWKHLAFQMIASVKAVYSQHHTAGTKYTCVLLFLILFLRFRAGMREACQSNQPCEHIITSTSRLSLQRASHIIYLYLLWCVCLLNIFFPSHSMCITFFLFGVSIV